MEIIQSKQNASIKSARKLLQRKHRKTSYLLEGWHLFEEAKASGAEILQVFVLEEMADCVANMAKVKLVSPEVLKELCETQTPQGIVAEVAKQSQALPEPLSGKYLLLEDVQDPGKLVPEALFRSRCGHAVPVVVTGFCLYRVFVSL